MPDNYYSEVNENGVVTPFRDLAAYNGVIANTKLIKDSLGWSGKNFNKGDANYTFIKSTARTQVFPFAKNVTQGKKYTVSFDVSDISGYTGSIALGVRFIGNDTAHDWSVPTSASGRISHTFTASADAPVDGENSNVYMFIPSTEGDNATITVSNIMFTDADVLDQTYEPHHESVEEEIQDIYDFNAKTGVHNLLINNATSETRGTIDVTHNADDTMTLSAGTMASSASAYTINNSQALKAGKYKLYGIGGNSNFYVKIQSGVSDTTGNGVGFTMASDGTVDVRLYMTADVQLSEPLTIKPMITLAQDTNTDYTQRAMTNRELTEKVQSVEDTVSLETGLSVWTINKVVKYGNVCTLNLSITASAAITTSTLIGTLPAGFRSSEILYVPVGYPNYNAVVKLDANGEITFTPPADVSVTNICIVTTFVVQTAPANREISAAPDTREASDPEPEAKETKKSTKKSTAKAD